MADDFGVDFSTFLGAGAPDLDPNWSPITGARAVAELIARGLMQRPGQLADMNDTYRSGRDLRRYMSKRLTQVGLLQMRQDIEREARIDERVESVVIDISHDATANKATVKLAVKTALGPFDLVLAVSQLTVDLIAITA